jgi:pimeloyl-ACP methyl ester carboxylesterase
VNNHNFWKENPMQQVVSNKVVSKDGTPIAFERSGSGPAAILVAGALSDRSASASLAALLADHFTVYNFDRRGKGESGDTPPYAVEREVEDIEALIDEAGGSAFLYGISSGAALALEAAAQLPTKVKKLALYEPPFIVDDSRPALPKDYINHLKELVASGRRGDAVEYFMTVGVTVPAEMVAMMRNDPMWGHLEAVAHTLPYDGAYMGDNMSGKPLPAGEWASAKMPTLVMDGGASPAWLHNAADAAGKALPNAQRRTLEGQTHGVEAEALAPVLVEFFAG